MSYKVYSAYRCIDGCTNPVNGAIQDDWRDDGRPKMTYYCQTHWQAANRKQEAEFRQTHENMGYYWKARPTQGKLF